MILNEKQTEMYKNCVFLNESLFNKQSVGYYATTYPVSGNTLRTNTSVHETKSKTLRVQIGFSAKGRLAEWKEHESSINEYNTPIIINRKYESALKNLKIYLYKVRFQGSFVSKSDKKYGKQLRTETEILETEVDSAANFIKKYNIPITFEDSKSNPDERKKLLVFAINTFKEELKAIKAKYPIKNSIGILDYASESYKDNYRDDFIDGVKDKLPIGDYDLLKFSKTPRDTDIQNEFWKYSDEFERNVNAKLSKYKCQIKADGDWDDGYYYLKVLK